MRFSSPAGSRSAGPCSVYSAPQIGQHDRDDVFAARPELRRRAQVAAEDGRERVAVGKIEEAECRDRDVELNGINPSAKGAGLFTAPEQRREHADERRVELANAPRLLKMARVVQILGREQAEKLGMLDEIVPSESDQLAHAIDR